MTFYWTILWRRANKLQQTLSLLYFVWVWDERLFKCKYNDERDHKRQSYNRMWRWAIREQLDLSFIWGHYDVYSVDRSQGRLLHSQPGRNGHIWGAIHSTKTSGLRFENLNASRRVPERSYSILRAKRVSHSFKMEDVGSLTVARIRARWWLRRW